MSDDEAKAAHEAAGADLKYLLARQEVSRDTSPSSTTLGSSP